MRNTNTKAFSFVEIIISLSIIVLLAVVGITASNNYRESVDNVKVTADIETLKNALLSYHQETQTLPDPAGNKNYYNEDTSYAHSSSGAFGVHGFFTEETLAKRYVNAIPLDPKTNQYYAYGKTYGNNEYELAGINWDNGLPVSFVAGNYAAEYGPYNLIREYNGPEFVSDGSSSHFPYNPDEKILVARVEDFSGIVRINDTINAPEEILNYNLKAGDKITVEAGGFVELYFSDGTISVLGDELMPSELIMSDMSFKEETNLFTKIRLVLGGGTIWTKASHLAEESEFEIYTTDSSAAVRGTIFGVSHSSGATDQSNITVVQGTIEVQVISSISDINELTLALESENIETSPINLSAGGSLGSIITDEEGKTYISVEDNQEAQGITISSGNSNDATNTNIIEEAQEIIIDGENFNNTIGTYINSYKYDSTERKFQITLDLHKAQQTADFILVTNGDKKGIIKISPDWGVKTDSNLLTLNQGSFIYPLSDDDNQLDNWDTLTSSEQLIYFIDTENITLSFGKFKRYAIGDLKKARYTKEIIVNLIDAEYSQKIDNGQLVVSTQPCLVYEGNKCAQADPTLASEGWKLVAYAPYDYGELSSIENKNINSKFLRLYGEGYEQDAESNFPNWIDIDDKIDIDSENNIGNMAKSVGEIQGVKIDNINNDDYIKYTGLNLNSEFAIEIQIEKPFNDSNKHYLIHTPNINFYIKGDKLWLNPSNDNDYITLPSDNIINVQLKKIGNEIVASANGADTSIKLHSSNVNDIIVGAFYNTTYSDYRFQLNSIIDYVKIYDKK